MVRTTVVLATAFSMLVASSLVCGACEDARLISPARGSTITDTRPLFEWQALSGQERYRVQLRSRVPEGEVLVSLDTVVEGTRFRPARPLTDYRAIVRIAVSAACDGDRSSPDDLAPFFIDTAPLCLLGPLEEVGETPGVIGWSPVQGAIEYESFFYEMPDSKLAARVITRESKVAAPPAIHRPAVLATRPRCATGLGDLQYLLLP